LVLNFKQKTFLIIQTSENLGQVGKETNRK
jgi:hypothetical protein